MNPLNLTTGVDPEEQPKYYVIGSDMIQDAIAINLTAFVFPELSTISRDIRNKITNVHMQKLDTLRLVSNVSADSDVEGLHNQFRCTKMYYVEFPPFMEYYTRIISKYMKTKKGTPTNIVGELIKFTVDDRFLLGWTRWRLAGNGTNN